MTGYRAQVSDKRKKKATEKDQTDSKREMSSESEQEDQEANPSSNSFDDTSNHNLITDNNDQNHANATSHITDDSKEFAKKE